MTGWNRPRLVLSKPPCSYSSELIVRAGYPRPIAAMIFTSLMGVATLLLATGGKFLHSESDCLFCPHESHNHRPLNSETFSIQSLSLTALPTSLFFPCKPTL
jgi:hypothetical protein